MVADIASFGGDLFATYREVAWHGLGNVFSDEVTDYRVMLAHAGLADWNMRLVDTPVPSGVSRRIRTDGKPESRVLRDVVADINGETVSLGNAGERYEIVTNEQAFAHLQSLADGARWETAGAIKGGTLVFGSIALDREIVLDPSGVADRINAYLLVYTSHDGSKSIAGGRTGVRVVCSNTLDAAMGDISQTFKFRHTATVADRMAQSAEVWRSTHGYFDEFEAEAARLYAAPVSEKQFANIVGKVMGERPELNTKGAQTKYDLKQGVYFQAWKGTPNEGIRGTAWGAYNALTEANQWGRNPQEGRGAAGQENYWSAGAGFDGPTKAFRGQALALAQSYAPRKVKVPTA